MKIFNFNIIIATIILLTTSTVLGQNGVVKKADKNFDRYAFIDARDIYLKVVEDGYKSAQIYENLGDTYYWNSDYTNAANWYEKLMVEFPDDAQLVYYYRAAQSLKSINKIEASNKYMDAYLAKGGDLGDVKTTEAEFLDYKVRLDKVSVNTRASDFGPSFYLNNVVYASTGISTEGNKIHNWNGQPYTDLFIAQMDAQGGLSQARAMGEEINTRYHETTPTFSKDGKTMYFTRNHFNDGKKSRDSNKTLKLSLYKATKDESNKWGNVVELPFNSKEYSIAHPALSPDEKRLYFSAEIPGGKGMSDIWYVDILGKDTYGTPVNLGAPVNTEARESFPFISESNMLFFSSDGRGGMGGYDVFAIQLGDSTANEVSTLGAPINSPQDDFGFILNEEKRLGYISSNRGGDGGSIEDDIYLITEVCQITINGRVFDVDTDLPIEGASVSLLDQNNNFVDSRLVGADGQYDFMVDCDKQYLIRGTKEGYSPFEQTVNTPDKTSTVEIPIPLKSTDPCPPNDLGCRLDLQPIYFDFDKHNIRPDAAIELAKILAALNEYPSLSIDIESHTDSRGNDAYNEALSERRAQSTLRWLINKGIDSSRLSAKGFGEYQLVNGCSNNVSCSEEEHQLNRRSMFLIRDN